MKLTVAIPTYDRNEILWESVKKLLPQLTGDCELHIVDNGSPVPVVDTLKPLLALWPDAPVRITRNPVNIGGAANILRCFELALGEWMWCVGDDDTAAQGAISQILTDVRRLSHAVFIHYSSPVDAHDADLTVHGQEEFIASSISYNGMMFTPAGVYRMKKVLPALRFGYLYAYTWGPHLAVVLSSLAQGETCEIRSFHLIVSNKGAGKENMWSPIGFLTGRQAMLELSMSDRSRAILAQKIVQSPSVEYIACEMISRARNKGTRAESLFLYDQIVARHRAYCGGPAGLRWRFYRPLVRWPSAGWWLVCIAYRIFGKLPYLARNPLSTVATRERFYRA